MFPFIIAFCALERGFHRIDDHPCGFFVPARKVIFWIPLANTGETYTAEITLSGTVEKLTFHYPSRTPREKDQSFLKEMFHAWAVLNCSEVVHGRS
jgi:hypothetical protein